MEINQLIIKQIRENLNITQEQLAAELGVSTRTVQGWEAGKTIPTTKHEILRKAFIESMQAKITHSENSEIESFADQDRADETRPRIPMAVAAGTLNGFADSCYLKDCQKIPIIKALPEYDYTMIVKGDSMEPKFEGGDEIAIRKVSTLIEWGKTYVLDTRDGAVLKRLYDAGDSYRCVSYNDEYPDFTVNKDDIFGVYKVVGLIRV